MRIKVLGNYVQNPSVNNISRASCIAVISSNAESPVENELLTIFESDGTTQVGSIMIPPYETVIVVKEPDQKVTIAAGDVTPVALG